MSFRVPDLIRCIAVASCLLLPITAHSASAEERMEKVVQTRQGLLKVVVAYFGPMVAMARGDMPYDGAKMKQHAHRVKELSGMLPYVFKVDTRESGVPSGALDGIWEDWADFESKARDLHDAAGALESAADEGQAAAMAAFRKTGGACKACHDDYREAD